jgi:chemotaxis protein MotB
VKKENLTAAGRGEYAPLMSNESAEGKAKNRRIEIILTPKLDEISKMLNDL